MLLTLEGFYDGVYTVAFNMHTLVQEDSSESDSDGLYDVLESILSALRVVLEEGQLPKEIQDYLAVDPGAVSQRF